MVDKKLNLIEESKLDIDYIVSIIQDILNKNHTDSRKKQIRTKLNGYNREINFNCPICGDGKSVKFRGHLYLNSMRYVCYNERETCSSSFMKFCNHFNVELDMEKKMQIYNYLDNNYKFEKKEDFAITNMDKLIDLDKFVEHMNKLKKPLMNLSPIVEGSLQHKYLIDRKIYNYENIFQSSYIITQNWTEPVIVILNRTVDKILSMQIRNLKSQKEKRIYKFFQFQELYNLMNLEPLDEIESIPYNKCSPIFNFLNIDFDNPIYIFEGYLDSIFFPNSVALVGLDTDISLLSNDNLDLKFVLDTDEAGQKKAKEMIDNGYSVFLWKRLFNDLSKGKGNKFLHHLESNIKDINGLVEFYNDYHIYDTLKLDKYFAKDRFDLIDM